MTENADSLAYLLSKSAFKAVITKRNNNSYILNNAKTYHFLRCPNENYIENSKYNFININQPIKINNSKQYDDFDIELKYDSDSIRKYKRINKLRLQEKEESSKLLKLRKKRKEYVRNKLLELAINVEKIDITRNKKNTLIKFSTDEKSKGIINEIDENNKKKKEVQPQLKKNKKNTPSLTSLTNNNETSNSDVNDNLKNISLPKDSNVMGNFFNYYTFVNSTYNF